MGSCGSGCGSGIGGFGSGGGGGGITQIDTGNTLWVDSIFGNDATAQPDRQDLPYLTVGAALLAVNSGDSIMVRPGVYAEEGLALPQGVALVGQGGWQVTEIGLHAAVSDIIQVSDQSSIEGIAFLVPSTAGLAGVRYTGAVDPTFSIYNCNFYGDQGAGAGMGDGLVKNGNGKIIGAEIRCDKAGLNAVLRVDLGVLALESIHVPPDPVGGTINAVALCERAVPGATPPNPFNSGRFQLVDINAGNPNVVDVVRMDGGSSVIFGINTFNVQNTLHITADNIKLEVLGGKMNQQFFAVIVDPLLTGANSVVRITANHQPIYDYPPVVAATSDFGLTFFQERFLTAYSEQRAFGTDLALGFPERGSALYAGKGSPYGLGMVALTTNSTATNVSDGGGFVDVTVAAQSLPGFPTSATVTFQGGAAGHSILWCSARQDATLDELKHWGLRIVQTTASVGGSYIFEIPTPGGAGQEWTEIGVMAVSEVEQYRYANNVFLRGTPAAPTTEILRWGIDADTTWENRTINGQAGYWCRVRITSAVATLPVFETMWLTDSFLESNRTGQRTASGLARWRGSIQASGNIWSETSLGGSSYTVGTGAVTWSHDLDNSVLSATADELFYQFNIPRGLDTSYPLKIRVYYMNFSGAAGTNTLVLDLIPLQSTNVLIADPGGGVVPIVRTLAATTTLTAIPGSQVSVLCTDSDTQLQSSFFESFDLSDFYEDDMVALRIQVADNAPDVTVWGLGIEGVFWSDGRGLL